MLFHYRKKMMNRCWNTRDQFYNYLLAVNWCENWWFHYMHVTHSDWHNFTWVVITGFIKLIIIKIKAVVRVTDIAGVTLSGPFLWYHFIPTYYTNPYNIYVAVCYKNWWIVKELNIWKEWLLVQRNKDIWSTVQQNCLLGFTITLVLFSIT